VGYKKKKMKCHQNPGPIHHHSFFTSKLKNMLFLTTEVIKFNNSKLNVYKKKLHVYTTNTFNALIQWKITGSQNKPLSATYKEKDPFKFP
jgi:hypothetical protein